MVDLPIAIFLTTLFRNVSVGCTSENAKMGQGWLDSKPHLMRSNIPTKTRVRKPVLEINSSGNCLRPEFVRQICSKQHSTGHIEKCPVETFRNPVGFWGIVSCNITFNSLLDEECFQSSLVL